MRGRRRRRGEVEGRGEGGGRQYLGCVNSSIVLEEHVNGMRVIPTRHRPVRDGGPRGNAEGSGDFATRIRLAPIHERVDHGPISNWGGKEGVRRCDRRIDRGRGEGEERGLRRGDDREGVPAVTTQSLLIFILPHTSGASLMVMLVNALGA